MACSKAAAAAKCSSTGPGRLLSLIPQLYLHRPFQRLGEGDFDLAVRGLLGEERHRLWEREALGSQVGRSSGTEWEQLPRMAR